MNFININETVETTGPSPSDEELQQVIGKVHSLGGLVIVNHIPWSNTTGIFVYIYADVSCFTHVFLVKRKWISASKTTKSPICGSID
jgi:hypothetical protein